LTLIIWTIIGISLTLLSLGEEWTLNFIIDYSLASIFAGKIWKFDAVEKNMVQTEIE
jgi:hypothetical protein